MKTHSILRSILVALPLSLAIVGPVASADQGVAIGGGQPAMPQKCIAPPATGSVTPTITKASVTDSAIVLTGTNFVCGAALFVGDKVIAGPASGFATSVSFDLPANLGVTIGATVRVALRNSPAEKAPTVVVGNVRVVSTCPVGTLTNGTCVVPPATPSCPASAGKLTVDGAQDQKADACISQGSLGGTTAGVAASPVCPNRAHVVARKGADGCEDLSGPPNQRFCPVDSAITMPTALAYCK